MAAATHGCTLEPSTTSIVDPGRERPAPPGQRKPPVQFATRASAIRRFSVNSPPPRPSWVRSPRGSCRFASATFTTFHTAIARGRSWSRR